MREILFRGKTLTNRWVYGSYYKQDEFYGTKEDASVIITSREALTYDQALDFTIVIPETVGQYTGLTDKNGKKIFEGDILKGSWNTVLIIFYDEISTSYRVKTTTGHEREPSYYGVEKWEVIGNIHDNPELLKGERYVD